MKSYASFTASAVLICMLLIAALAVPSLAEGTAPVDYAAALRLDMASETAKAEVTVRSFIDGDTTHFYAPSDVTAEGVLSGRYLAVNTPESTGKIEPYGKKASAYTREKLQSAVSIFIESDDAEWHRDSNGTRYLVWVWYQPEKGAEYRNLNVELLQEGLAKANSSGQNRYGDTCMAAIAQAKAQKLNLYSDQPDPDFYYGEAIELTLRELRLHPQAYEGMKVAFTGVVTMNSNNSVYVEAFDAETELYFGMPVYYGYNLSGGGMEVLHIGNEVRIVGTLQFYEVGGIYQISGITYRMMKPNDPGNIQKLSEGHSPACVEMKLDDLLDGTVTLAEEDGSGEYSRAELALATSIQTEKLTVTGVAQLDSGWLLLCTDGSQEITVRTAALPEDGDALPERTVKVRGIVDLYNGMYQIKAFSPDGITILND